MKLETTLVATLGGQPQIITFTMDLLRARGIKIDQVILVYLDGGPRYVQAFRKLMGEFAGDAYFGQPCHLRSLPVRLGDAPLGECCLPAEIEAVRDTFQELLADLKQKKYTVHLGLSGGRRLLSLIALEVAMRYLSPTDHLWHIFTPQEWADKANEGALMHLSPESGLALVEVPFIPWGSFFPGLKPLLDHSPQEVVNARMGFLDENDRLRCRNVLDALTLRQREVLKLFAEGLVRKEIAALLNIKITTVDSHKEGILATCSDVWGKDGLMFDPRYLGSRFGPFLKDLISV